MDKKKRLDIGILTYWNSEDNYGQILQCYALQTFLRAMGHNAFLIRYDYFTVRKDVRYFLFFVWKCLKSMFSFRKIKLYISFLLLARRSGKTNLQHPRFFEAFKNKYIISTDKIYTADELRKCPPSADVYICGSDQIWSGDPIFFLDFGETQTKRIAYAPSFGGAVISRRFVRHLKKMLYKFDVVTVREKEGIEICKRAGRTDVSCVLDPTLLLNKTVYEGLIGKNTEGSDNYILLYLLGNKIDVDLAHIYQFAKKNSLTVKYVASQGRQDDYEKYYPSIPEWLQYIRQADYIMTNSFHGVAFSILFNKKFVVFPLAGSFAGMNQRIISLLSLLGLEDRIYSGMLNHVQKEINYDLVNVILKKKRDEIADFMQSVL